MDRNASRIAPLALLALLALPGLGSSPSTLAGEGEIVIRRDVQPRVATRPSLAPDPDPLSVNANSAPHGERALSAYELGDGDFASVTSGIGLAPQAALLHSAPVLDHTGAARGLPGMAAARSGGSGIAGQVNRTLQRGLAPLHKLTGDH